MDSNSHRRFHINLQKCKKIIYHIYISRDKDGE